MIITSILGLLSSKQRIFVNRLSQLLIKDSGGSSSGSETRKADTMELNVVEVKQSKTSGKKMLKSK